LFFTGEQPAQLMVVSSTGCLAIQTPDKPIQIYHWHFRMKGSEIITLDPTLWAIVWSCRAPWNAGKRYLNRIYRWGGLWL
jgi:hypothetical protein